MALLILMFVVYVTRNSYGYWRTSTAYWWGKWYG